VISSTDAEIVRRMFDDFNRGDFDAALALVDERVEWEVPPGLPDSMGAWTGHRELFDGFARFIGGWERLTSELEVLREAEGRVVVDTRWHGRSRGTGIEVDQHIAQVYELRDGKVTRVRQFRTREEALGAP
jgi:hypothetical protein